MVALLSEVAAGTYAAMSKPKMDDREPRLRGDRVKALRMERGWTQFDLSMRTKMDTGKLSRIERQTAGGGAHSDTIARIALALETSTDYLLNLTDNPKPSKDR